METTREHRPESARSQLGRWFSILGPPIAWAIQLVSGDAFSELGCDAGGFRPLDLVISLVTVGAALVAIAGLVLAFRTYRRERDAQGPEGERRRFMSVMGMLSGGLFLTVIVLGGVLPQLFLLPCER